MKHVQFLSILFTVGSFFCAYDHSIAADENNKFSSRGVGGEKCESLIKIIESKDEKQLSVYVPIFIGWVDGYISYINRIEKNTYNAVPFISSPEILALLNQQCKKRPDMKIEETVNHVVSVLAKYKIKKENPTVNIAIGKISGIFYKDTIIDMQNQLIKLGFYKGDADGNYNDKTINAMKSFQKNKNLADSGFPNIDTVLLLLYK